MQDNDSKMNANRKTDTSALGDTLSQLQNSGPTEVWTTELLAKVLKNAKDSASMKFAERWLHENNLAFASTHADTVKDEHGRPAKELVLNQLISDAKSKRHAVLFIKTLPYHNCTLLAANDARNVRRFINLGTGEVTIDKIELALQSLASHEGKNCLFIPSGDIVAKLRDLADKNSTNHITGDDDLRSQVALAIFHHCHADISRKIDPEKAITSEEGMSHLDRLEAESIHIIREVIAQADNPVMLYSVGKDSAVMLHLARKAFYPSPPPFPLLHVDTRWKFQAMYDFRDYMAAESGMDLLIHTNPEGIEKNINPLDHGSALHTDIMKTQGLKQALDHYKFDVAFGGARRDEEKSRAKERIFSFRTSTHGWDAKNQRPELWNQYNGRKHPGESIRVFPISNWTELDIWQYIYREQIPIVPLYFAQERPVVERDGMLLMVDDDRLKLFPNEQIKIKKVRFRTLGCYPLTGAIESDADDLASIVLELLNAKTSERQGRAIDSDSNASMEKKKEEGYF
jgi:sulfate adenylyltransferase subunit 2